MKHGVIFNKGMQLTEIDTLDDYGLMLLDDVKISPATPRTNKITIPGRSGTLDLSEVPQGFMVYDDREVSFRLYKNVGFTTLQTLRGYLLNALHGRNAMVTFPFDTDHYYYGRIQIGDIDTSSGHGVIPVSLVAHPYRYDIDLSGNETAISLTTTLQQITLPASGMIVTPSIHIMNYTSGATIGIYDSATATTPVFTAELNDDWQKVEGLVFHPNDSSQYWYMWAKTSTGTCDLYWQYEGGWL